MGTLLFIPLTMIAFFESTLNTTAHQRLKQYFSDDVTEDEDDPKLQDPETDGEEGKICTEKFADLIKAFPKYVLAFITQGFSDNPTLQHWRVCVYSACSGGGKASETGCRAEGGAGPEWKVFIEDNDGLPSRGFLGLNGYMRVL
jgi:hypothetical protein